MFLPLLNPPEAGFDKALVAMGGLMAPNPLKIDPYARFILRRCDLVWCLVCKFDARETHGNAIAFGNNEISGSRDNRHHESQPSFRKPS